MKRLAVIISSSLLIACGGGGGGSSTPDTTFPAQAALAQLYTTGFQKTTTVSGTATVGNVQVPLTGTLQLTQSAANTQVTFNGEDALQYTLDITGTLSSSGQSAPFASTAQGYINNAYKALGATGPGSYCVASTPGEYPTTVTIGQTGEVARFNCFTDSTQTVFIGTETVSYAISAGTTASNATASIIEVAYDLLNQPTSTARTNYLIDTSGGIVFSSLSLEMTDSGMQLSLIAQ